MPAVSVVIPTLNAGALLAPLLQSLHRQTLAPAEILVVDSGSADDTQAVARGDSAVRLMTVAPGGFNHGGTRHEAFMASRGEFVCFLTQDALPADDTMLEKLIAPFTDERVAGAYARQIARREADPAERLTRTFNYPADSRVYDKEDIPRMGVRAFFFSDACSAYRRTAYVAAGGFERRVLTNEDMLFASRMLACGYRVAYAAQARVVHSHRYSYREEFRRYFDIGAFWQMHGDAFGDARLNGEGLRYVTTVSRQLLSQGHPLRWVGFGLRCVVRLAGRQAGKRYRRLRPATVLRLTGNPAFWKAGPGVNGSALSDAAIDNGGEGH